LPSSLVISQRFSQGGQDGQGTPPRAVRTDAGGAFLTLNPNHLSTMRIQDLSKVLFP
jgi:hypothetical protein